MRVTFLEPLERRGVGGPRLQPSRVFNDKRDASEPRAAPILSGWKPCALCGDARETHELSWSNDVSYAEQHCGMRWQNTVWRCDGTHTCSTERKTPEKIFWYSQHYINKPRSLISVGKSICILSANATLFKLWLLIAGNYASFIR